MTDLDPRYLDNKLWSKLAKYGENIPNFADFYPEIVKPYLFVFSV